MFYISDMSEKKVKDRIDEKTKEVLKDVSNELHFIFSGVKINDMRCWGTE